MATESTDDIVERPTLLEWRQWIGDHPDDRNGDGGRMVHEVTNGRGFDEVHTEEECGTIVDQLECWLKLMTARIAPLDEKKVKAAKD